MVVLLKKKLKAAKNIIKSKTSNICTVLQNTAQETSVLSINRRFVLVYCCFSLITLHVTSILHLNESYHT